MTTHDHNACCGGHGKEQKSNCCGARNWITAAAVAVAVAAVVYAGTNGRNDSAAPAKLSQEQVASLIAGEDSVVATLNGKDIRKSDVAATIREMGANVPPENIDQVLPAFIEQYINLRLLNDAAAKEGTSKDETVQSQIASSREQIIRAAYIRDLFEGIVTEEALQEAYNARYEAQPMPEEAHARHILLGLEDEALARDLIAQLQAGANFAKLAEDNSKDPTASRGGDLGYFVQSEMVPEFGNAVFAMRKGELSAQPIKTQFGWHIVKLEDKRQRVKPTFEEARQALDQEARQAILDAKLTELRKDAKIEIVGAPEAAAPAANAEPEADAPTSDEAPAAE